MFFFFLRVSTLIGAYLMTRTSCAELATSHITTHLIQHDLNGHSSLSVFFICILIFLRTRQLGKRGRNISGNLFDEFPTKTLNNNLSTKGQM